MLPLSHDEVVHGKGSLIGKMAGDEWQQFANLRLLFGYMWTHPGAKLIFMGDEFGQTSEWNYKSEIQWHLLEFEPHKKMQDCVKALNHLLREEPALYSNQFNMYGFEWVDLNHRDDCVIVYRRKGKEEDDDLLILLNLNPVPKEGWQFEVNREYKKEIFNSDDQRFWGTGDYMNENITSELIDQDHNRYRVKVNLPPLSGVVLK